MSSHEGWGDPEPFGEDEDGEPLFWECPNPECSTQKTTAAKAAAHCAGEDENGDLSDTVENDTATDPSSTSEPGDEGGESGVDPTTVEEISVPIPEGVEIVREDGELLARQEPDPETGLRTDPAEFARYYDLLMADAPEGYVPHLLRCAKGEKGPALQFGSWKAEENRLDRDEAIEWLKQGGNVGIAGIRADPDGDDDVETDPLVNMDIDDRDAVPETEVKPSLGACSRSRVGDHRVYFDTEETTTVEREIDDESVSIDINGIPNIAPDCGEIRTDTQYVVAPGSHVPVELSDPDDPDLRDIDEGDRQNIGRYTIAHEQPGATIAYEELPSAYRSEYEDNEFIKAERDANAAPVGDLDDYASGGTAGHAQNGSRSGESGGSDLSENTSGVYKLSFTDVSGVEVGDRVNNPLGHHGDSEGYFTWAKGSGPYDHKYEVGYTPLSYLLCEAGERHPEHPNGGLSFAEHYHAWKHAKDEGYIDEDDPIPLPALFHVLTESDETEYDTDSWVWRTVEDGNEVGDSDDDPDEFDTDVRFGMPPGGYNDALDLLDEAGIDHGREHFDGGVSGDARQYDPEVCAPPAYDPEAFDREQRWDELQGERYEAFLDASGPHVWGDPAGVGKSTNAELGAAGRDRSYFMAFDKHAKARAAITDDATPDGQFHIKGGEQPVHDCCMDVAAAAVESHEDETPHCPEHGHPSEWPRMCPIYNRSKDDDLRQRYEALVGPLGALGAHLKLGLFDEDKHPWHGGQGRWAEQFDELRDEEGRPLAERVAGVHEYQLLKSASDGRDTIVDETPRTLATEQRTTVEDLAHARVRLESLADIHESNSDDDRLGDNLRALGAFADDLVRAIASDDPGTFAEIDAPTIHPLTFDRPVDPEDLPPEVDPEDVERTAWREYQGVNDDHYTEHERATAPVEVYDEPLAKAKLEYNEGLVRQYQDEDEDLPTAPFCFDALLAAAAKAGIDRDATRKTIAVPAVLDSCPWCGSSLDDENGARVCAGEECDWDERENTITQQDGDRARASAWLDDDPEGLDTGERPALVYGELPDTGDLPSRPLVLDATATPEKVAGLYGARTADVEVTGDAPLDLGDKFHLTQVVGGRHGRGEDERYHAGGQYHKQTILDTPSIQRRIQNTIEQVCELHERPLFGIKKDLIPMFEFPENAVVVYYGGARGLNYEGCDAVCCIGAPHPDVEDLRQKAELLALDNPDLRVGGDEYSTRRNAPNPPVYRKLLYEDEDGDGLAVPTKAFSGLVGALFRETRANELEQFIHRVRPHLVDEAEPMKHGYLLTDVPTDLAVDEVAGFEELADPLRALFPAPEGALRLLAHGHDAIAGDAPDGFREGALVERCDDGTLTNKVEGWHDLARTNGMDVTKQTVYNWVHALESTGLLTPGEYEQRRGVSYSADIATLKSALQVLSRNGGLKVAAVRRFTAKVRASEGGLDWLAWAEAVFDLSGDRCGWDPPPNPAG